MILESFYDGQDKEISNIKALLDSATVDPNVKGGLRWSFSKASSENGYRIFEACHVKATIYKNQTLRLRVRETDRFNERIGTGEIKREVTLILKDINSKLQVNFCALVFYKLFGSLRLILMTLAVCRSRTLRKVVFWKCFVVLLELYGTSCIAMPILHDKRHMMLLVPLGFSFTWFLLLGFYYFLLWVGLSRIELV